jgi:serine/threonine protein kinase
MFNALDQKAERYQILDELGEGGMATVYKAHDQRLEREVAIKFLRRGAFPPDQMNQILARFEREAKSLARLSHPNIVKVHDFGEHEGAPYLVMEYLPGGTLKSLLGQPLPWAMAMRMLIPVARALIFAHERGIVHRDVKPANIMISASGDPMLTDFGIAKLLENEDGKTLTGSGVGIGTPEYMAPEQGLGGAVDERVDIYSLGVVLYEMIAGRKPYTADTPLAVVLKQINDPLPRPKIYAPDLPDAVENMLIKAMAKDPQNRFENMNAFCQAMENMLSIPTLSVMVTENFGAGGDRATASETETVGKLSPKGTIKKTAGFRLSPLEWAAIAGMVLILVGAFWLVFSYLKPPPADTQPVPAIPGRESTFPLVLPAASATPTSTFISAPTRLGLATQTPIPAIGQTSIPDLNAAPVEVQLIVGTLNLEGTNLALTSEQAVALLPLWNEFKTLNQSIRPSPGSQIPPTLDSTAQAQKDALLKKIQNVMSEEQIAAITGMQITQQNTRTILQSKGITLSGPPPGNPNTLPGGQPGGGQPQGAPRSGGGQPQGTPPANGGRAGGFIGDLIDALIPILEKRAAG